MTDSSTNGTSSLIWAGVTSATPSTPHDFAEAIRRRSSSIRSSVRATSMPPHSCSTPASRYWRIDSSVSCVISFEWSTGKMKLEAWPVEPPGFGNGPLSSWTRSVQPSSASQPARLLPTIPPPITTTRAFRKIAHQGPHTVSSTRRIACSKFSTWARIVAAARAASPTTIASRRSRCGFDRLLEILRAVERDHPDAQGEDVVLAERLLEQVVVGRGVDGAMDALVERHHEVGEPRALESPSARELLALLARSRAPRRAARPRARAPRAPPRCARGRGRRRR